MSPEWLAWKVVEKIEEKKMSKFKVGDRVRRINYNWMEAPIGSMGTVTGGNVDVKFDNGVSYTGQDSENLELIQDDSLESLVKRANDGIDAFNKIRSQHREEVEWTNGNPFMMGFKNDQLRIKKPTFKPFTTSNGYEVRLEDKDVLHIGCESFHAPTFRERMNQILEKDQGYSSAGCGQAFYATKTGIKYKSNVLPYTDAERIYEQLKEIA